MHVGELTEYEWTICSPALTSTQEVSWSVWCELYFMKGMFFCHSGKQTNDIGETYCVPASPPPVEQVQEMDDGGETVGEFYMYNTHTHTVGGYVKLIKWAI